VHRALRGRMAERPASAVASAREPRWTEPLTITVGVQNLWGLYRVWGLSGKRAVGGVSGGACHQRAEIVLAGACGEASLGCSLRYRRRLSAKRSALQCSEAACGAGAGLLLVQTHRRATRISTRMSEEACRRS
jgi:hypothetical protein